MSNKNTLPETRAKRQILLIDDHPLVRRGLNVLIDNEPDLTACDEAATHKTGLAAIATCRPDLVITDFVLHDGDGLGTVNIRLHHDGLPVLMLSMYDAPIYAERAFQAGASGYVTKQEMTEIMLIAIRCVLDGERYISPKMKEGFAGK